MTFESLQQSIASSPLLARYNYTKPIFLKPNWSATGMGYIPIQLNNSEASKVALTICLVTGDCDFDYSQSSTQLQPIIFKSHTYSDTKLHYHGFLGEIACDQWDMATENGISGGHIFPGYAIWLLRTRYSITPNPYTLFGDGAKRYWHMRSHVSIGVIT